MRKKTFLVALVFLATAITVVIWWNYGRDRRPVGEEEETIASFEPAYFPGGLADAAGETGFIANPKGGLDAVNLATGEVLWHSDAASYPLVLHKDRLYAQERYDANPMRIVALNLREKGKRILVSDPIELVDLPDKRRASPGVVAPHPKDSPVFCRGRMREGQLYVEWLNLGHFAVHVDPHTGKVSPTPPEPAPGGTPVTYEDIAKVAADPDSRGPRFKLHKAPEKPLEDPKPRNRFHSHTDWKKGMTMSIHDRWVTGNILAVLVGKGGFRESEQILVCWDLQSGKHLHSSCVSRASFDREGIHGTLFQRVADHGRRLVALLPPNKRATAPESRRYFILSVETGNTIHELITPDDHSEPWPVGPYAFYSVADKAGATLKAIEMLSGKLLWERRIPGSSRVLEIRKEP